MIKIEGHFDRKKFYTEMSIDEIDALYHRRLVTDSGMVILSHQLCGLIVIIFYKSLWFLQLSRLLSRLLSWF